jgi:transmembrane 9 superfamily protein 2/4
MRVSKLTSIDTLLPYGYYWLPFPKPMGEDGKHDVQDAEEHGNLGDYLQGHEVQNAPYEIKMLQNDYCKLLARSEYDKEQVQQFRHAIRDGYHVNWIVDNLPNAAAVNDLEEKTQTTYYDVGHPVGQTFHGKMRLNNHVKIMISYHPPKKSFLHTEGTIVGFLTEPISVKHQYKGNFDPNKGGNQLLTCYQKREMASMDSRRKPLIVGPKETDVEGYPLEVIWTYDVLWHESDIEWASRWDVYLSMANRYHDNVHWFSILNSSVVVLFLSGIVGLVLLRSLRKDISIYNQLLSEEERELLEESGWKLVSHDVFRPPDNGQFLCVLTGTGMQLLVMASLFILGAAFGYLNPARRGSIAMGILFSFVGMGSLAGYTAGRLYKLFQGKEWKTVVYNTAMFLPTVAFSIFFILNLLVWGHGSARAVPFGSIMVLVVLWFCVTTPLVFLGAYYGIKQTVIETPVGVAPRPSTMPEQPWFLSLPVTCAAGGLLPFAAIYVELYFIFSSLWLNQYYYVFGFLLLIWCLLIFTCAEVSMLFCYFQLNKENYHWWWRAFLTSASTGVYIFFYGIYYFFTKMNALYFTTVALYFGYMFLFAFAFAIATGTIGFFSCLWFVIKIYGAIKCD